MNFLSDINHLLNPPDTRSPEEKEAERLRLCKLYKQDPNCGKCKQKINHYCGICYVGFVGYEKMTIIEHGKNR